MRVGVRAVAEVIRRQQVKVIHHFDDVGRANFSHLVLLVVEVGNFLVDAAASLADKRHICHAVFVAAHVAETHHDGFDLLVAEHAPRSAAPRLLETRFLAAHIVPTGTDQRDADMLRGLTSGQDRDSAPALFIACHTSL